MCLSRQEYKGKWMVNLYELLGVKLSADDYQIQQALMKAAEKRTLSLEQLGKVKGVLLDEAMRTKYNQSLFAQHPELKDQLNTELEAQQSKLAKANAYKEREQQKQERVDHVKSVMASGVAAVSKAADNAQQKRLADKQYRQSDEYKAKQLKHQLNGKNMVCCNRCGHIGKPVLRGNSFITLVLLLCWIVPGIIYMAWRRGGKVCQKCKSTDVVYTASPKFQKEFNQSTAETSCPFCKETIIKGAIKCKHCGSELSQLQG